MNSRKQRIYETATKRVLRLINTYRNQGWLNDSLPTVLTSLPVRQWLLYGIQGKVARAARQNDHSFLPCTMSLTQKMGLFYSHIILDKIEHGGVVTKLDFHPRWWLFKPVTYETAFKCIRDPGVVATMRGRLRVPKNIQYCSSCSIASNVLEDEGPRTAYNGLYESFSRRPSLC